MSLTLIIKVARIKRYCDFCRVSIVVTKGENVRICAGGAPTGFEPGDARRLPAHRRAMTGGPLESLNQIVYFRVQYPTLKLIYTFATIITATLSGRCKIVLETMKSPCNKFCIKGFLNKKKKLRLSPVLSIINCDIRANGFNHLHRLACLLFRNSQLLARDVFVCPLERSAISVLHNSVRKFLKPWTVARNRMQKRETVRSVARRWWRRWWRW